MNLKLSHTLRAMLMPLLEYFGNLPVDLAIAIHRTSKRGLNKTKYPNDLARCNVILETTHDVTGKVFSVMVERGNMQEAIEKLRTLFREEDYLCSFSY